jgi:hypothetical protein
MATRHGVEAARWKVGRHGVTEAGVHREAAGGSARDKLIDRRGCQVDRRHAVADGCRGQSQVAGTGCVP